MRDLIETVADLVAHRHESERMGRGVPQITSIYGRDNIEIANKSVTISIPFEMLDYAMPDFLGLGSNQSALEANRKKADIGSKKPDIDSLKESYLYLLKENNRKNTTVDKVMKMVDFFGFDEIFGREDLIREFGGGTSATSNMLRELLKLKIIISVNGHGKGKYRFNIAIHGQES